MSSRSRDFSPYSEPSNSPSSKPAFTKKNISTCLNDDILIQTFLVVIKTTWKKRDQGGHVGIEAMPFVASHVCHRWRVLSLSSPVLWSSIHITIPLKPKLIQLWHCRSFPVHINFRMTAFFDIAQAQSQRLFDAGRNVNGNEVMEHTVQTFRSFSEILFLPHMKRYRSIFIHAASPCPTVTSHHLDIELLQFFQSVQMSSSVLQKFSFKTSDRCLQQTVDPRFTIFPLISPSLATARIGYPFLFSPPVFANLRKLEITIYKLLTQDFHSMVRQCYSLESLVIDGDFYREDFRAMRTLEAEIESLPRLHLPCLSTLVFTGSWSRILLKLTTLFSTTSCRHLVFHKFSWWDNLSGVEYGRNMNMGIDDFLELRILSVSLEYIVEEQDQKAAFRCLGRCFPQLHILNLSGIADEALSHLEFGDHALWPNLHVLRFWGVTPQTLTNEILRVVRTRRRAGHPVHTLAIDGQSLVESMACEDVNIGKLMDSVAVVEARWNDWLGK